MCSALVRIGLLISRQRNGEQRTRVDIPGGDGVADVQRALAGAAFGEGGAERRQAVLQTRVGWRSPRSGAPAPRAAICRGRAVATGAAALRGRASIEHEPEQSLLERDRGRQIGQICADFGPLCRGEPPDCIRIGVGTRAPVLYNFPSRIGRTTQENSHD